MEKIRVFTCFCKLVAVEIVNFIDCVLKLKLARFEYSVDHIYRVRYDVFSRFMFFAVVEYT